MRQILKVLAVTGPMAAILIFVHAANARNNNHVSGGSGGFKNGNTANQTTSRVTASPKDTGKSKQGTGFLKYEFKSVHIK